MRAAYLRRAKRFSKLAVRDCYLFNLAAGFVIGACTCVTLCSAQRGTSREITVAAEHRSFPEGFRLFSPTAACSSNGLLRPVFRMS